ncbi:MAG: phosphotransferase [Anaerolineales bacterium]|nr:phosphotransferase [Anaerolineales bacterium]
MNLPSEFISNIQGVFKEEGHAFLKALPNLITEASARWGLTDVRPAPTLSYNFVAFARRGKVISPYDTISPQTKGRGDPAPTDVVLKMGVPNDEMRSEMAALRLFDGEGACKLLDYDEERCWMLLEKLNPGVMLSTLEDDEEATHIAADVMKRIWVPLESDSLLSVREQAPAFHKFIQLTDWFDGLKRLRNMYDGGTGPLNEKLVERVESSVKDFFAENHSPVLMHGDFHHFNILSSERGWLVIDPKGVIGPAGYEVGPFMINPWGKLSDGISRPLILKRIDILHEHLGFERERILEWSLAHAILSAWWGVEDRTGWEYASNFAEMLASL